MQRLKIDVLQASPLPSTLPAMTELGVWKRSTGYEVYLPYHRSLIHWVVLLGIFAVLIVGSVLVYAGFPVAANTERMVFYVIASGLIIGYAGFVFFKYHETRNTKVRIDMTPKHMVFTRVLPSNHHVALGKLAVGKIDEVIIDESKGLSFAGEVPDPLFQKWFGAGLKSGDLYYLALLVGQVAVDSSLVSVSQEVLSEL
jgi:hypothetical protein